MEMTHTHTQYTHYSYIPKDHRTPTILPPFYSLFFFFGFLNLCLVFRCVSCLPLYSGCQVFSGLAIKWLLASMMSYKAPAKGEKGTLRFKAFVPETLLRLLSPEETNANHVIQENDFRFSVSSNI